MVALLYVYRYQKLSEVLNLGTFKLFGSHSSNTRLLCSQKNLM